MIPNERPLVSIVIPVYNGANFLADAIRSAQGQTYPNIEIVVVNDGSRDHGATREVALSFGDGIRYFEKENGGCGSAFNYGIERMRGAYFSWLSHDDFYDPKKIERQLEVLFENQNEAKVACCSYRVLETGTGRLSPQHYFDVRELTAKPFYGLFRGAINGNCLLISKDVFDEIGRFDESLRTTQDYDLFYRLLQRFSIVYHDDVLVTARVHPQQDTIAKYDLAMNESDELWSRFIAESPSIGVFTYERSPLEYWAKLANHLWQSPYPAARERVFEELRRALEEGPKQDQPLVSIVIPFVRVDDLFLSAIKSAVEQTYTNLEIVAAANIRLGADSLREVHSLARASGRQMIVVDASEKRGASYARNRGLDAAKGELIALLDADDFWHPKKIEYQVAAMIGTDCSAVSTAYSLNHLDVEDFAPKQKLYYTVRDYLLTLDRIFPTPSFMFRATPIRFDENMTICEDMDFFSKLIGDGFFLELPFKLCVVNTKPVYAWNVSEAYSSRMSVCVARGVSEKGDEFETELFLTLCRVALSRGELSDLQFVARNWSRVIRAVPRHYVTEKFARHLARRIPAARTIAAQLRRARSGLAQRTSLPSLWSVSRGSGRSLRSIVYHAMMPSSIERRIVAASSQYRALITRLEQVTAEFTAAREAHAIALAQLEQTIVEQRNRHQEETARLERSVSEHDAVHTASLAQIAQLEQTIAGHQDRHRTDHERLGQLEALLAEHRGIESAHRDTIVRLESRLAEHLGIHAARIQEIARLEQINAEQQRTHKTLSEQIVRLEEAIAQRTHDLAQSRLELAAAVNENSALRGQVTAYSVANNNQSALITGRLSLLDYSIHSLVKSAGRRESGASAAYLDLMERALVGLLTGDPAISPWSKGKFDPDIRAIGRDWPQQALTMIGTVRMRNLRHLLEQIIQDNIPGDLIETGVWRGGACIYMRAILAAHNITDRTVWVADSFSGLPRPNEAAFPADLGDIHYTFGELSVSLNEVRQNFERYGLLDEQVRFLEGWFKDTLPSAPIERLALMRLDGDMYESTIQALDALYVKLSAGGFVIVDDYILEPCRKAVEDFRMRHEITAPLEPIDGAAVFWRKSPAQVSVAPLPSSTVPNRETLCD
ncbi:glycosyltransferase [Bradyrhizobium sp. BRP22]|uniref:TylF/MycF/NovP-related O-methyltransferase n=1 Tax=Bradyrhizobium sp. BRP22 TaxID=2793821 RepID=UPI001CD45A34|nr:TylF/MycF/NovP-related O-methyltransferase [Bradyrhizobium sp. BRP22]MCA1452088.1 glycosyltransferase [Bradyrhizobium sp. BRP22]